MRGIRFIKTLCKEFNFEIVQSEYLRIRNFRFYYLRGPKEFLVYIYKGYISVMTVPYEEKFYAHVKSSEKYKIKQLIYEVISYWWNILDL